jgi:hypothetical protein
LGVGSLRPGSWARAAPRRHGGAEARSGTLERRARALDAATVGAPAAVYRSLAMAPLLVARNARLYARLAGGWRPRGWVRTKR